MQHLTLTGEPGYDIEGFQPSAKRLRLFGGGGGKGKVNVPAPEKPPQASKAPTADVYRQQNAQAAKGAGTPSSTMLTDTGGVADSSLNLGKNTLLGE